jgi:hypothetical protein
MLRRKQWWWRWKTRRAGKVEARQDRRFRWVLVAGRELNGGGRAEQPRRMAGGSSVGRSAHTSSVGRGFHSRPQARGERERADAGSERAARGRERERGC